MGEVCVWSEMDAGNWWAHRGKGKFDIETGWAQKVVERWGVEPRHWNEMKTHEDTCKKLLRDAGGIFGTRKWMPEEGGGNLDIETRCMQEGVERNGGTCRYWSQVTAENWWERGRWERGKLDTETRMNARSCWDEKRKSRYWTQMTVHARSCGETRGSWDIPVTHRLEFKAPRLAIHSQAAANSPGWVSKSVQAVRTTLHGTSFQVACSRSSSALLSEKLRCRRGWTETGESIQKGYGLGKGQVEQEGRMSEVQQEGEQVQKKGSHLEKNCSTIL